MTDIRPVVLGVLKLIWGLIFASAAFELMVLETATILCDLVSAFMLLLDGVIFACGEVLKSAIAMEWVFLGGGLFVLLFFTNITKKT